MEFLVSLFAGALLFSFLLCIVLTPLLSGVAIEVGLVDRPAGRKKHKGNVPLVGGVGIYVACQCFVWATQSWSTEPSFSGLIFNSLLFLSLAAPLVLIGVLDDKFDLRPRLKFATQILVSLGMIFFADMQITSLGNLFGYGAVELPVWFSVLFTVFCVIGVINAINMIDGMDGLAGLIVLITFSAVAVMAYRLEDSASLIVALMLMGSVSAYLFFNLKMFGLEHRVFLGDAGSMFLGFGLLWLFIGITQKSYGVDSMSPIAAGWFFGLPLIDIVSVSVARLKKGRSPFSPGRDHVHHQFLDAGVSPKMTVLVLTGVHSLLIVFGFAIDLFRNLESLGFWVFVGLVVVHHFVTPVLISVFGRKAKSSIGSIDMA